MKLTLRLAAIYNILWGFWVVLFPQHFFSIAVMEPINYPVVWQGMGMVIGVYGLGYFWASYDPIRHWPIVAVGFLGKVFGPIGFLYHLYLGNLPITFGWTLIFNDLIWWVPFFLILKRVYIHYRWSLPAYFFLKMK
ncbi:MAG: alkyl hydroperoxide reductase [Bacteroidota bacterium]